jgi:hypothetical protein
MNFHTIKRHISKIIAATFIDLNAIMFSANFDDYLEIDDYLEQPNCSTAETPAHTDSVSEGLFQDSTSGQEESASQEVFFGYPIEGETQNSDKIA